MSLEHLLLSRYPSLSLSTRRKKWGKQSVSPNRRLRVKGVGCSTFPTPYTLPYTLHPNVILMIKWIRTSRLSRKNFLSVGPPQGGVGDVSDSKRRGTPLDPLKSVDFMRRKKRGKQSVSPNRGGLVFKAHRLLCLSTLGSRVIKKKNRRLEVKGVGCRTSPGRALVMSRIARAA